MLPLRWARRLGGWLGEKVFTVLGFRRGVILENLRHAFPHSTPDALERLARGSFRSVGTSLFELLRFPSLSREQIKSMVQFSDHDLFHRSFARKKGVILLTAHFGNWELVPQAVCIHTECPFLILYKVQSNRWIDARIAERRAMFGNQVIPMGMAVREMLRVLNEGKGVAMASDQSAPRESIRMDFFGREVPVFQGVASFALKTGAALITAFAIRQPDGTYRIGCREIPFDDLANNEGGIGELTSRHLRATEAIIREYPEQWMWMHRRWKHVSEEKNEEEAA